MATTNRTPMVLDLPGYFLANWRMDAKLACDALAALGQPTRLSIVELLAAHPVGLSAGDIARELDLAPSTLSTHLSILTRAGMLTVEKNGRSLVYTSAKPALEDLASYLSRQAA